MAKNNSKLAELRASVTRQEKAVAAKISRTKKKNGAVIAGTVHDVRRDKDKTRTYNSIQLQKYSEQLSSFMDRNKQFVVYANNRVATAGAARLYKLLETRFNKKVERELESVAHLSLPRNDGTILDRMQEMVSDRMNRAAAVNVSMKPPVRDVRSITSEKSVKTLTDDYLKRLTPEFQNKRMAEDKKNFINSLIEAGQDFSSTTSAGNESLVDLVNKLSDRQFATVWKYTALAGTAFLNYESMRNSISGKGDTLDDKDIDAGFAEVRELLTWAQMLSDEDMKPHAKKKK